MLFVALAVDTVLQLLLWAGLALLGLWAYRRLHLPSIPWLLAYALLTLVVSTIPRLFHEGIFEFQQDTLFAASGLFDTFSHTIVAWFLVAEFAFVLSNSSLTHDLPIPKAALLPREHAAKFGIALLACCLAGPLFMLVQLLSNNP